MKRKTRCGSVKVTRYKLNLTNNQFVRQGMTTLVITHYKDGHYAVSVNGNRAKRVNALFAAALVSNGENLNCLRIETTEKEN